MKNTLRSKCMAFGIGLILCFGTAACGREPVPEEIPEAEGGISATAYIVKADGTKVYLDEEGNPISEQNDNEVEAADDNAANGSDPESEDRDASDSTEGADENNDLLGHYNGNVYENTFFGIGCKLKNDWEYLNNEEMEQLSRDTAEWMDTEEMYDLLESGRILHAMSAGPKTGGASMSINIEKLGDVYEGMSVEEYYQAVKEPLCMSLEAGGIEVTNIETITMNVFGEDREVFYLTLSVRGTIIDEFVVCLIRDGYVATCTVGSTYGYDETADLLTCFVAIP